MPKNSLSAVNQRHGYLRVNSLRWPTRWRLVRISGMRTDRPKETEAERADRNFGDLLQEIRVAQTGVQILFAFLLTMPLQSRFERLDDWERGTFIAALLLSAGATICLIAPVAYHRALFARQMKRQVVNAASKFAIVGLALLAMAIICAVDLVLDLVLGRRPALIIAGGLALLLILAWVVLPIVKRFTDNSNDDLVSVTRSEAEKLETSGATDSREGERVGEH
jgi:hypothetical protein